MLFVLYFLYFFMNSKLIVWKLKISSYGQGRAYCKLVRKARGEGKLRRRLVLRDEI